MTSETPIIEIRDLVRRYGRNDAVNGLSLAVSPGRCWLGMRNQGVLDGIWPRAARQALFIAATMSVLALIIGLARS